MGKTLKKKNESHYPLIHRGGNEVNEPFPASFSAIRCTQELQRRSLEGNLGCKLARVRHHALQWEPMTRERTPLRFRPSFRLSACSPVIDQQKRNADGSPNCSSHPLFQLAPTLLLPLGRTKRIVSLETSCTSLTNPKKNTSAIENNRSTPL